VIATPKIVLLKSSRRRISKRHQAADAALCSFAHPSGRGDSILKIAAGSRLNESTARSPADRARRAGGSREGVSRRSAEQQPTTFRPDDDLARRVAGDPAPTWVRAWQKPRTS